MFQASKSTGAKSTDAKNLASKNLAAKNLAAKNLSAKSTAAILLVSMFLASDVNAADWGRKLWTDSWVDGTFHAKDIVARIKDATVGEEFTDSTIYEILTSLASEESSGQTIVYMGNNIYDFFETFDEEKNIWTVYFPAGNWALDNSGTYLCFIDGAIANSQKNIIWKPGTLAQIGIQFRLNSKWTWEVGTDARGRFRLKEVAVWSSAAAVENIHQPWTLGADGIPGQITNY